MPLPVTLKHRDTSNELDPRDFNEWTTLLDITVGSSSFPTRSEKEHILVFRKPLYKPCLPPSAPTNQP